jgi:RimJ/RimL family protein N-acetyltransferase
VTRQASDWVGARPQPDGADGLTDCGAVARKLRPVTLSGLLVRLEPLEAGHVEQLAAVGLEPELWRLQPRVISSTADMRAYVREALDEQRRGVSLPFAIVDLRSRLIVGSTRFMDIALPHRRLEIGATWLTPVAQRSGANIEAKLLLLIEAFEELRVQKVVFKTETLNEQSQRAIRALGGVEEGAFRKQFISESGRARDMVYFAIFAENWTETKTRLQERLDRYRRSG